MSFKKNHQTGFTPIQAGFTMIELVVVVAVFTALIGYAMLNLLNTRSSTVFNTTVSSFVNDLRNQQTQSMVSDTQGRSNPDAYGIYIKPDSYTLFHGIAYSSNDSTNFVIPIDTNFSLSTTFPSNSIIFATGSGTILNYSSNNNSVVITEKKTGKNKTLQINQYGALTN